MQIEKPYGRHPRGFYRGTEVMQIRNAVLEVEI